MYIYLITILRLKHGHHLKYRKGGPSDAASPAHSDFSLSRFDRGSAIALGILLVLILPVVGWFCCIQIKKRKERDVNVLEPELRDHHRKRSWLHGPLPSHGQILIRHDSRNLSRACFVGLETTTGPPTPGLPRRASCRRHQSSVRSIDSFVPARRASLSQTQCDERRCSEVASRGGCIARANRRLSTLTPILEPRRALQAIVFDDVHVCERGKRGSVRAMAKGP
ncbi:uncharacterized protein M421DRAFT_89801 [Didymella exigua CBS 183.55]|uniref:Uncharacterized protein n=1 Tax=Didymella exigua CBS 183.55 TaxID=1150837 RepID=A0A6A5RW23_9PLEO|nr:uncharacterized protein M421DRAFT_89801 [Didymella exigua CBS 183.55]KAF1931490.1 hypothetical protein M421DRAFT_89801 [Didymella exigua CBS 183.55]